MFIRTTFQDSSATANDGGGANISSAEGVFIFCVFERDRNVSNGAGLAIDGAVTILNSLLLETCLPAPARVAEGCLSWAMSWKLRLQ